MVGGVEYSRTAPPLHSSALLLAGSPHVTAETEGVGHPVRSQTGAKGRHVESAGGLEMAEQTTSSIVVDAPASAVMDVIADFDAYPQWAKGVTRADVRSSYDDGRAEQVFFALDVSPIKDEYTLAYEWDGDREVTWTLVEGKMLRALDGAYELRESGTGTEVTYRLALDVSIPLIGMLKRKGEKILIDTALKGLKKRVESLG
jgi:ribosome-associated toxin RatA of RatAB toxin-antitoxin module